MSPLNDNWVKKEIKREPAANFLEMNENRRTLDYNLLDKMKAV